MTISVLSLCCLVFVRMVYICITVHAGIHYSKYGPALQLIIGQHTKPQLSAFILKFCSIIKTNVFGVCLVEEGWYGAIVCFPLSLAAHNCNVNF